MSELRRLDARPTRRLLIAGGGNIGRNLARNLENRYSVKVLERSRERARGIAEDLLNSIVLVGDCADEDLLREENIEIGRAPCRERVERAVGAGAQSTTRAECRGVPVAMTN